ncbi:hypothetical protein CMV_012438 [Castanea mollissima]|uniref:Uncharacterized protein n=1 Tax=Castanea mollissima TaxID=60419 RepID=A0A8J4RES9_9ROSI|nr:hypothetical protein CMV_012438 [Castanea mollissima]
MRIKVTKSQMEREELYDAPNNLGPSEQELPLEDFGDYLDHTLKKAFGMENELLEDKEDDKMDMHHKSGGSADIVEVEDCSVIVPLNIKDPHVSQTKG